MAKKDVQFIGFDGGRGYIKAYTESIKFNSKTLC